MKKKYFCKKKKEEEKKQTVLNDLKVVGLDKHKYKIARNTFKA